MESTRRISVALPVELAQRLSESVAAGDYATESDVIEAGLQVILGSDRDFDRWLRHKAGPAYDAIESDPNRGLTLEQARSAVAALHAKTIAGA